MEESKEFYTKNYQDSLEYCAAARRELQEARTDEERDKAQRKLSEALGMLKIWG